MYVNMTANATGPALRVDSNGLLAVVSGTWGGGTLALQYYSRGASTWLPFPGAVWDADTATEVRVPAGSEVRAVLAGATSPSLHVEIIDFSSYKGAGYA